MGPGGIILPRVLLVEDRTLLDGYRRGSRDALARVFEAYGPRVVKWVSVGFTYVARGERVRFRGFASPYDQHDLVSEVFRLAFEERARLGYSGLKPFEGYLFAITKNAVMKRLGVRDALPLDDAQLATLTADEPSPEEAIARSQEQAMVQRFLADLSAEDRRFVELRFVDQSSQVDVAASMGWSRKKVRLREQDIRGRLTRFLKRSRGRAELLEATDDAR